MFVSTKISHTHHKKKIIYKLKFYLSKMCIIFTKIINKTIDHSVLLFYPSIHYNHCEYLQQQRLEILSRALDSRRHQSCNKSIGNISFSHLFQSIHLSIADVTLIQSLFRHSHEIYTETMARLRRQLNTTSLFCIPSHH